MTDLNRTLLNQTRNLLKKSFIPPPQAQQAMMGTPQGMPPGAPMGGAAQGGMMPPGQGMPQGMPPGAPPQGMPSGPPPQGMPQGGSPEDQQMMAELNAMAQQMGIPPEQLMQMLEAEQNGQGAPPEGGAPPEEAPQEAPPEEAPAGNGLKKLEARIKNLESLNKLLLDKIDMLLDADSGVEENIQKTSSKKSKNMLYYIHKMLREGK